MKAVGLLACLAKPVKEKNSNDEAGMKNKCIVLSVACGLGLWGSLSVQAEDFPVKLNGFASAGFVTGDMEADFFSGTDVISESATFGADNTIGLQISAEMNAHVSFTGQLLAKGVVEGYNLEAHWAFVDYHPRHDFSVRAGRLVLPIVMGSEYLDVGYAYPWVRPPAEVYSGIPMTSYSGVDILYTLDIGDANLVFQPYVGSLPPTNSVGFEMDVQLGLGLNTSLQFEYGSLRAHVMKVNDAVASTSGGGLGFGMDAQLVALGADLEFANVVFVSEYMAKEFDFSGIPGFSTVEGEAWYVMLGYRMGKFLPHITFASADSDVDQVSGLSLIQASLGGLLANPAIAGALSPQQLALLQTDPLSAVSDPAVVSVLSAGLTPEELSGLSGMVSLADMQLPPAPLAYKQQSITLGLRWDVLPRTALKFEYQEIEPQEESWGLFVQEPADDKVSLFSFAIDVTF